jgi:hypothetical protein
MSFQAQPTPAKGSRRTGLLVFGLLVLIGGVGAGIGLFLASGTQYEDAVKGLQRAPVGCDTEFDFTGTGTFYFYAESKGSVGDLRGDCENTGTDYSRNDVPRVDLTLVDDNGDEVDLDRNTDASYDKSGFVGTSVRSLTIDTPGQYVLSVVSDDSDFAVAVGRNPKDDFESAQKIAFIVGGAGLVLGLLLTILGLRRKPAAGGPNAFPPGGGFPPTQTFPTTAPTYAGPNYGGPNYGGPTAGVPGQVPSGPPLYSPPPQSPPAPGAPGSWGAPQQ